MTSLAEAPTESATADMPPFSGADMAMRMDYAGNHPGKLATIIALNTFDEGEFATRAELLKRLKSIQGDEPGWDFAENRNVPPDYCRKSLEPAGMVEFGTTTGKFGKPVQGIRLTAAGRTDGVTLAGALIPLDLTAPKGVSLQEAMGSSGQQRAKGGGEPSRLAMYRYLIDSPRGVAASLELRQAAGRSQGTACSTIRDLGIVGIFSNVERTAPGNRTFFLAEPAAELHLPKNIRASTLAVIRAAMRLRGQGETKVTGADILEAATLPEGADKSTAWGYFLRWISESSNSFLTEQRLHDNLALRTQIAITQKWRPFLRELLRVRDLLTGEDKHAAAFRASALAHGRQLHENPRALATVLARAEAYSRRGTDDWLDRITGLVPGEGIVATELHRVALDALGMRMTYERFRHRLGSSSALTISTLPGGGVGGGSVSYVTPTPRRFPADWQRQAACLKHDPELFYPDRDNYRAAEAQAAQAMRICDDCPVRIACLKTTLETKVRKFGVSGGVWWEKSRDYSTLTEEDRRLASAAYIEPRPTI